jgi:hypothetical protein
MVTNEEVTSNNASTYNTARIEQISLMVLPAIIGNAAKKLNVNVMLERNFRALK